MTTRKGRIGRNEVALAAGVSPATVSLVIRDSPLVKDSTKKHVQHVIEQMGYEPNAAAKALRSARAGALGYMMHRGDFLRGEQISDVDTFHNYVIRGIMTAAETAGQHILLHTFVDIRQCISLVKSHRIDGLLVDWEIEDTVLKALCDLECPLVIVGRAPAEPLISFVKADEEGGAYAAVRHLLSLGYQRIGLINGIDEAHPIADERVHGYCRALSDGQKEIEPDLILHGDWSFDSGYRMALHLLSQDPRPDALFVLGEVMAAGALKALRRMSLYVPDDVAVVTTASSSLVEYTWPELTAVQIPMYHIGKKAVEVLLNTIDKKYQEPLRIVLPTKLLIRESSASARTIQRGQHKDVAT